VLGEGRGPAAGDACWLCADPVHLRLHQERLILADGGEPRASTARGAGHRRRTQSAVSDAGTFHVASPDRWYLQLAGNTELGRFDVLPLSTVAGRSVGRQLPETAEARWLRRLLNEAQMVLHQHPANREREDAGRSTINSLWLWGAGVLPTAGAQDFTGVWSDHPLARGWGALSGTGAGAARRCRVPSWRRQPGAASNWSFSMRCSRRAVRGRRRLPRALLELEAALVCAAAEGARRRPDRRLRLEAPTAYAALAWESDARDQWRLWRRPQPLAATAQRLARGDTMTRLTSPRRPSRRASSGSSNSRVCTRCWRASTPAAASSRAANSTTNSRRCCRRPS
jgi:hypothetical protein